MMPGPQAVLGFWLDEIGPEGWYKVDAGLDAAIRDRFGETWTAAREGGLDSWQTDPRGTLALLIVLDQFPRNMFRGEAQAFSTDARAVAVAKAAIGRGFDRAIATPERQFFYLPLMHAEGVPDQERSVRLYALNFPPGDAMIHARAHRAVIRRFGRFPFRNAALGRHSTPGELAWLAGGGYATAVAEVGG